VSEKIFPEKPDLDSLKHYGVKGMKWGVINEDRGGDRKAKKEVKKENREKKASEFDAKADVADIRVNDLKTELKDLPPGARTAVERYRKNREISDAEEIRDQFRADAESIRKSGLTEGQKKALIGAAIVGGLVAYGVVSANVQSGEFNRLSMKGKAFFSGQEFKFNRKPEWSRSDMTSDEIFSSIIPGINPDYGDIGTKMNCRRCTFTYEMRRRGYNVTATKTTNAYGQTAFGLVNAITPNDKEFKTSKFGSLVEAVKVVKQVQANPDDHTKARLLNDMAENFSAGARKTIDMDAINSSGDGAFGGILKRLSSEPDGSRGELGVVWQFGGGHSMIYEVFNGKAVIFDGQTGKKYEKASDFEDLQGVTNAGFTRLDNVPLNETYLMRWLKNA